MVRKLSLLGTVKNNPQKKITCHYSAPLGMTMGEACTRLQQFAVAFDFVSASLE